jgi:methyl coenzyme M reductase subunit C-like uncharacterized protein (methanogenesis marker protein 7)
MSLQEQPLGILQVKKQLLEQIIEENADDPRVEEPKRQLQIIEEEIKRREENERPPDLVVGLDTLTMKIDRG